MLELLLMMVFGNLQKKAGKSWHWAIAFTLIGSLFGGFHPLVMLLRFLFSWAYFYLLVKFEDNLAVYLMIYLLFPLSLFGVTFAFMP